MDGYLADGRRNLITFYGKTQKEAKAKANEYHRMRSCGLDTTIKHTFATWADFWYENHKDNIAPSTQENYKYILETLKQELGSRRLLDIKAYDIEQLLKTLLREGRSKSYIASARGMLFQIFNKAEANDLIFKNPVRFAEKMNTEKGPPKRKDAFHANEVRRLMELLPHDRIG